MSATINISSRRRQSRRVSARNVRAPPFTRGFRRRPNVFMRVPRQIIVRQASPGEKKFFDTSASVATTAAWAIVTGLAAIAAPSQGQTIETRVGDRISVTSINVRMFLSLSTLEAQTAITPEVMTRVIVGVIKVGGTVTVADVVDTGSTTDILSYRNLNTVDQFQILKDFTVKVKPDNMNEGAVDSFAQGVALSDVIKFTHVFKKPLDVRFVAGTNTTSRNGIFVMAVSTVTGATMLFENRARYTDG